MEIRYTAEHAALIETLRKTDQSRLLLMECGTVSYRQLLEFQKLLQGLKAKESLPDVILFTEHPPVITLGVRKDHNLLKASTELIAERGVELVQIHRGGGSTCHNPGQLVIYPIIDLQRRGIRVLSYVRFLEQLGIDLCASYGLEAGRRRHYPGVWVDERKLASVGVEITRNISMHGIALNICNDLSIFELVVPCGIEGVKMTSLSIESGQTVELEKTKSFAKQYCIDFFSDFPVKEAR